MCESELDALRALVLAQQRELETQRSLLGERYKCTLWGTSSFARVSLYVISGSTSYEIFRLEHVRLPSVCLYRLKNAWRIYEQGDSQHMTRMLAEIRICGAHESHPFCINDEGLLKGKPTNLSALALQTLFQKLFTADVLRKVEFDIFNRRVNV